MLVLSRKLGERILVPHCGLVISVHSITGKSVRLALSAPPEIGIFREEIWLKDVQKGHSSAESALTDTGAGPNQEEACGTLPTPPVRPRRLRKPRVGRAASA